jgi:membrane protease YdiL (CAAX protease family)
MTIEPERPKRRIGRAFSSLFLMGLVGVLSLLLVIVPQLETAIETVPQLADLPEPVILLVLLLQPVALLALATVVGVLLAPRVGLRSLVYEKATQGEAVLPQLRPQVLMAFVTGILTALVIALLDVVFMPFLQEQLEPAAAAGQEIHPLAQLLMGMLYGGITEELLLRWGFMSFVAWIGWRIMAYSQPAPGRTVMWGAIIISAVLFGIGHLPALASLVPLTALLVVRTVLLNAVGGIIYGWLFWRSSLEVAMIAHASTHIGFLLINLLVAPLLQ